MDTHFAPPNRAGKCHLSMDVTAASNNPLVDGLMSVSNGLFAVLNEHRQIVSLNESFLQIMGIHDASSYLGLRLGEYLSCVHACKMPSGCGTSSHCASCGAVISIMSALTTDQPHEGTCALTVEKDSKELDLFYRIRSCPVKIEGKTYILLFLHDISVQQQRAHLESTFFHDINNLLTGLLGKSELFSMAGEWDPERFADLQKLIQRMASEFAMQQALASSLSHTYQPLYSVVVVNSLLEDLSGYFDGHPLSRDRDLQIADITENLALVTDTNLVHRILVNMISNALEATEPGGTVKLFAQSSGAAVTFSVWNRKHIPQKHALRIFTRNFSTKNALGHGLGTFSMKLFGEKVLGGMVDFTTSESEGTTFSLTLMQQ